MTPDKTVEAVARAVYEAAPDEELYNGGIFAKPQFKTLPIFWGDVADARREQCFDQARAAIKAHTECLMEPSEEMTEAAVKVMDEMGRNVQRMPHTAAYKIFQAMLSAHEMIEKLTERRN